ncbi:dTMP kinase [Paracoccus aerodenitrificans]|uniref:dTMP kinase n=1 Tax=Paracoccus aerodenitrificans TaxID=3017781 RepID=UPI0022F0F8E2|nr:dTMP kinase [Paracoccus aerodenitrificans]WBU64438.1 dTMP kinase [Paracoccus aerodenitrificans]
MAGGKAVSPRMFISFEGIDGSGKSTQARLLAETLREEGHEVVLTREPGGSEGAELIRRLLVEGGAERWSAETEILLFNAARRDHIERTILPALARNATVISDRFADSTRVYQGATRGDLTDKVEALHRLMIEIEPDRTFVIDIDPSEGLARGAARGGNEDRFESMGLGFQEKLRAGFAALAAQHPERVRMIDGTGGKAEIAVRVRAAL